MGDVYGGERKEKTHEERRKAQREIHANACLPGIWPAFRRNREEKAVGVWGRVCGKVGQKCTGRVCVCVA